MNETDSILLKGLVHELGPLVKQAVREVFQEAVRSDMNIFRESDTDLIRIDEACQVTGLKKATLYSKTSKGEIPHMKRGKTLYFSKKELENWIRDGRQSND